jgi:hypothetical protein
MEKKDIVIASLRFIRQRTLTGQSTSFDELKAALIADGQLNAGDENMEDFVKNFYGRMVVERNSRFSYLTIDSYFDLLDYEELLQARQVADDARQSATRAEIVASKSLRLTMLSLGVAIVVGLIQIFQAFGWFENLPVPIPGGDL